MTDSATSAVTDGPRGTSLAGYLAPLRSTPFRWLLCGQVLSTFGDMILVVALPFIVFGMGGAGSLTALLAVLGVARVLGAPLGGLLADRWRPRQVMLAADVVRALVLVALVPVVTADRPSLVLFGVGVAVLGAVDGLFLPAYWALIPRLLPTDQLAAGNAVGEAILVATVMCGTFVAGLAGAAFSPAVVLVVNAVTFLASACTLLMMRVPTTRQGPAEPGEPAGQRRDGLLAFARGSRLFQAILLMSAVLFLTTAGIMTVALPVFVDETLAGDTRPFGLLLSAQGAGLLVGTLAAGLAWKLARRGLLAIGLLVVDGVVLTVFPHLPGLGALAAAMFVLGITDGVLSVLAVTILQQAAPDHIRGRVMATFGAVTLGAYPVSAVLIGLLVVGPGTTTAFVVSGIGVLVAAALGCAQPSVRKA